MICVKQDDPEEEGALFSNIDNIPCILQKYDDCKGLSKLTSGPCALCEDETRDPGGGGQALQVKLRATRRLNTQQKMAQRRYVETHARRGHTCVAQNAN